MKFKKKKNEFNYFDEFAKSANLAKGAAEELKNYIFNFEKTPSDLEMKKIHEIENDADKNLHELKNYLLKDFLPPIDREDIIAIAHKIDDLVDGIDEVIIDINIYNITKITENMKKSISLLKDAALQVNDLIVEFKNLKKIKEIKDKIIEINKIEEQADRFYEESIKELYKNEKDFIQIVKWSKVYETVEECFDACENIADCIEEVLVKNS